MAQGLTQRLQGNGTLCRCSEGLASDVVAVSTVGLVDWGGQLPFDKNSVNLPKGVHWVRGGHSSASSLVQSA